jgi:hypothetical protein
MAISHSGTANVRPDSTVLGTISFMSFLTNLVGSPEASTRHLGRFGWAVNNKSMIYKLTNALVAAT